MNDLLTANKLALNILLKYISVHEDSKERRSMIYFCTEHTLDSLPIHHMVR